MPYWRLAVMRWLVQVRPCESVCTACCLEWYGISGHSGARATRALLKADDQGPPLAHVRYFLRSHSSSPLPALRTPTAVILLENRAMSDRKRHFFG